MNISSDTELVLDAVVSSPTYTYPQASFGHIIGGYNINGNYVPTTSAHFYDGKPPAGGNILYMDGHVAMRPLKYPLIKGGVVAGSSMAPRTTVTGNGASGLWFWW